MCRVGFLLNHDATHQVVHSIPIALELARRHTDIRVVIITTTAAEVEAVKALAATYPDADYDIEEAPPPGHIHWLNRMTGGALPLKRLGVLWHHRRLFRSFAVLVVPEKTSVLLKSWLGEDCPYLVNIRHGAGDRACGNMSEKVRQFDLQLLPGPKYERLVRSAGLVQGNDYAVIGYAKIDHYRNAPLPSLFDNDRPTVLYTPHFDPWLSSWYPWGEQILEYFAANRDFNLIFAPHVLLFKRRWHVSSQGGLPRLSGRVPAVARQADNILVDAGSEASVDMTYTRAADIYMGDVSSQVYEFLYRPRPCLFLNPSQANWRDSQEFRFWHSGQVIDAMAELPTALAAATIDHVHYREEQQRAFADAFDLGVTPSAERGAVAIARFLAGKVHNADPHLPGRKLRSDD